MNSRDATAKAWDEFLASSPRGQFQQSSGWAQVKAGEGWSAFREYLDPADPSSGGFQLLWKQSRFARIGYVSKGPVLPQETAEAVNAALEKIVKSARRLRLSAVVVQPPDDSLMSSEALVRHGFFVQPSANGHSGDGYHRPRRWRGRSGREDVAHGASGLAQREPPGRNTRDGGRATTWRCSSG